MVYWVLGDNNETWDRNTLIDAGSSNLANLAYFMREMAKASKGMGKLAIEQIILTHGHSDHSGGLPGILHQFNSPVYSMFPAAGTNVATRDGMHIRIGNQNGVILHTPGHSDDSLCVFLPESGTIFSGDTLIRISDNQGTYPQSYVDTLERLAGLDIKTIYPGHGLPIKTDAAAFIKSCLEFVRDSRLS
jgi:glyoxylase-like metal-dependent hydrolase (beta-lactamase superfamily II)